MIVLWRTSVADSRTYAWICRDAGTHLYNLDTEQGLDGLNAAYKTFGTNHARCEIIIALKPTAKNDYGDVVSKPEFTTHITLVNVPKREAKPMP
jgi:hypothetical protein